MQQLTLDTASINCAVHIQNGQGESYHLCEAIGRGHAERILPMIDEALSALSMDYRDIKRLGVTVGPGSFTGVRVGLSVARGLALALDCPLIGISLLDALSCEYQEKNPALVVLNARREAYFACFYDEEGKSSIGPKLIEKSADWPSLWAVDPAKRPVDLIGSGAAEFFKITSNSRILTDQSAPNIEVIAKMVAKKAKMKCDRNEKPSPLYLRAADAKSPSPESFVARKGV